MRRWMRRRRETQMAKVVKQVRLESTDLPSRTTGGSAVALGDGFAKFLLEVEVLVPDALRLARAVATNQVR